MIKSLIVTFLFISLNCQDSPTSCDQTEICLPQDDCPDFLKKRKEFRSQYKKGQRGYEEALTDIRRWICNKKERRVCCPTNESWLPRKGECGLAKKESLGRVVGGNDTTPGQFPFTALVGYPDRRQSGGSEDQQTVYKCGGVLINHWYVLTAAHCQGSSKHSQISSVRLGEWEVGQNPDCIDDTTTECLDVPQDFLIRAEQVTVHEDYRRTPRSVVNDIALVKLDRPAVLNNGVQIVCLPVDKVAAARELNLPDLDDGLTGKYPTVVGWGYKNDPCVRDPEPGQNTNVASSVQQMLGIPVLSFEQCKAKWGALHGLVETQICAGGEYGKDSCSGDSGGPLYMSKVAPSGHPESKDLNPVYLMGLVSFGSKCCGIGRPGVYTRVDSFVPWIENKIGRNNDD